jgi:hypothetical protein
VPVFPFWLINLLMGLTPMGAGRFYGVSQLGMLAGTAVYVNAGTQLAAIQSPGDILSPGLLGSFVLLGLFPLLAKAGVAWLARRKVYAKWTKPRLRPQPRRHRRRRRRAGLGLHRRGRQGQGHADRRPQDGRRLPELRLRAEQGADPLGQDGAAAEEGAVNSGVADAAGRVDFAAVMKRVHDVIADIEPHDSVERYTGLGVEVLQGHARITSPWTVEVTLADGRQQTLTTKNIVIAAGASPFVPPIPGLKEAGFLTSDTVWGLTELPRRLVVLGGGPIGSELAQSFARLGSAVTQVEMAPRIMVREDPEVSELVAASLRADGVDVLTGHQAVRVEVVGGEKRLIAKARWRRGGDPLRRTAVRRGPQPARHGLRAGGTGHPAHAAQDHRDQRLPADPVPQHLRRGRRGRAVPVHAHGGAPGLVCRCQRAVRPLPQVQGRLQRDPLGHLHRPRGGARGPERERGQGAGRGLRGDDATASTTSTAPLPTAPRTASSRCSPCRARTRSWA